MDRLRSIALREFQPIATTETQRTARNDKWKESIGGPVGITIYIAICTALGLTISIPLVSGQLRRIALASVLLGCCVLSWTFLWITHVIDPGVVPPNTTVDIQVFVAEREETLRDENLKVKNESNIGISPRSGLAIAMPSLPRVEGETLDNKDLHQSRSNIASITSRSETKEDKSVESAPVATTPVPPGAPPPSPRAMLLKERRKRKSKGETIWKERGAWTRYFISEEGFREKQRYCKTCNIWREPDVAHCNDCGFCMKRMDHHCPAMGSCVAAYNHRFFVLFLISSGLGSCILLSSAILARMSTSMKSWQNALIIVMIVFYAFNMFFVIFGLAHCYMLLSGQTTRGNIKNSHMSIEDCECSVRHYPLVCCAPIALKYKWSSAACAIPFEDSKVVSNSHARVMDVIVPNPKPIKIDETDDIEAAKGLGANNS